jgi:isoleucyl-tRNA synthetase
MDRVRDAASAARMLREKAGVRVRQPLAALTIAGPGVAKLAAYESLLRDEVNVKRVELAESIDAWARFQLQVNARAAGPRLGGAMKSVLAAAKQGRFERLADGRVRVADQVLEAGEWQLRLDPKPGVACEPLAAGDAIVVLDTALSDALVAEGIARDVVRGVQQTRKEAGLHVSDRIRLVLAVPPAWRGAVEQFQDWIAAQTLARRLEVSDAISDTSLFRQATQLGEHSIEVGLARLEEPPG